MVKTVWSCTGEINQHNYVFHLFFIIFYKENDDLVNKIASYILIFKDKKVLEKIWDIDIVCEEFAWKRKEYVNETVAV